MYWIYFVLLVPLNNLLPAGWGKENGVVETLQLLLLASCIGVFIYYYGKKLLNWNGSAKALCLAGGITFFLLMMREISWGRVLILRPDGSISQYSDLGIYGKLVHPIIVVLIIIAIACMHRAKVWRIFKYIKIKFQYAVALILFAAMARLGESHCFSLYSGNLAEELAELGAYAMLLIMLRDSFRQLQVK